MKKLFYVFLKYVENRDKDTIAYKEGVERIVEGFKFSGSKGIIVCAENEDEIVKSLPEFLKYRYPNTPVRMESLQLTIGEPASDIVGKTEFLVSGGYITSGYYDENLQKLLDGFYKKVK